MVTISIFVPAQQQANREEIKRICGSSRIYPKGPYFFANIPQREEADFLVLRLNELHGVQARILELTDANR